MLAQIMPIEPGQIIESRQLLNFITLADTKSYTETANRLGLTQSAISHSIKTLEGVLGHQLFQRSGKQLYLTETGKAIWNDASESLKRMESIRKRCQELNEWGSGRLRISMGHSPCQFMIPEVLREYRRCFPSIEIHIQPADSPSCFKALRTGEVDLAIAVEPMETMPDIVCHPLFQDELNLAVAAYHPWVGRTNLPLDALKGETCLIHGKNSYTGHLILSTLRRSGLNIDNIIELGSYGAIHQMIAAGVGYSFLPDWTIQHELASGQIKTRSIPKTKIHRNWVHATRANRQLSLHEETFIGLCLDARDRVNASDVKIFRAVSS